MSDIIVRVLAPLFARERAARAARFAALRADRVPVASRMPRTPRPRITPASADRAHAAYVRSTIYGVA